jgi:hypothetical protein
MTIWKHMADTHGLILLESEIADIMWAANKDAEQTRMILANQVTELVTKNLRLKKAIRQTLEENSHMADGDNCTLKRLKDAVNEKQQKCERCGWDHMPSDHPLHGDLESNEKVSHTAPTTT